MKQYFGIASATRWFPIVDLISGTIKNGEQLAQGQLVILLIFTSVVEIQRTAILFQSSFKQIKYLLDYYIFSNEDIELNKSVLLWPKNINPIFDKNDEVRTSRLLFICYCIRF